jgi:membrane-associated protease RseP (regulator of RpoE activity)
MQVLGIVLFAVSIILVILIHEAAHYGVAKAFKIKVEEFYLGFGPRLWSFRRGETEYGVKALPLGGYVKIAGMNPYVEPTPEEYPRTFGAKPIWQRALVIFAGPFTHFVLAFLIFAAYFGLLGEPTRFSAAIGGVERELNGQPSPAFAAGLRPGDEVVRVDELVFPTIDELRAYTTSNVGQEITLTLRRGDEELMVSLTPVLAEVEGEQIGRMGVTLASGRVLERENHGFFGAFARAGEVFGETTVLVFQGIGRAFGPEGIGRLVELLFTGAERQIDDPTTVVGIGQQVGSAAESGFMDAIILLIAGVNMFVGFLNLLPLLPFDGGHLAVLAVEKVRGRKVDMRKLMPITAVVAVFLIIFMMSVLYLDIVKPLPDVFR